MTEEATTPNPFAQLGLREALVTTLGELGYEQPTPIQAQTIPILLKGADLIGQAQTGTGKTAAFALPLLEKVDPTSTLTQALVLTPTRELAMQVAEAIHTYARGLGHLSILPVYGGAPMVTQLKRLDRGVQIVVGTPGRLIDHLDRGSLDLSSIRMIVLDEADEMLKMGFIDEVERILSLAPPERQVALFSATMPEEVRKIAQRHLKNPQRIEIEQKTMTTPMIEQRFINLSEGQKLEVLTQMLELEPSEAVLIFRRTKLGAAELAEKLEARGFSAVAMHGDMTQPLREQVIRRVKSGQVEIVVATDVAARGLDVEQIAHVVNYDVPYDVEAYVHRIGRTGRAGRSGMATLFVTPRERRMMREIERYTGAAIKPMKMPTRNDVAAKRVTLFKESLRKSLEEGDLDLYLGLVEELVDEGGHDMAEVAAAAARMANGSRSLVAEAESAEERDHNAGRDTRPPRESRPAPSFKERPARRASTGDERPSSAARSERPERTERPERGERPARNNEPKVRLALSVGKNDGIRPADIVGSIANEADVPGSDIGPIDIRDDVTIVVIPEKYREQVLTKTARAKFRGRPLNFRVAEEGESASGRDFSSSRPAPRPWRDDAPRSESSSYAKKPYEKKPYEKKSFDRKPYEKKPFEKKPYERKSFDSAERPARTSAPFARDERPRTAGAPYEKKRSFGAGADRPAPRGGSYARRDERPDSGAPRRSFGAGDRPAPRGGSFARRDERPGGAPKRAFGSSERSAPRSAPYAKSDAPAGKGGGPFYSSFAKKRSGGPADSGPRGGSKFKKRSK